METMYKEFIPYNEALALEELDIAMVSFGQYWKDKVNKEIYLFTGNDMVFENYDAPGLSDIKFICQAPLYQQAFRFFREKYKLEEVIQQAEDFTWYKWKISQYNENGKEYIADWYEYNTYEEAELACLQHLIKIVNENKKD